LKTELGLPAGAAAARGASLPQPRAATSEPAASVAAWVRKVRRVVAIGEVMRLDRIGTPLPFKSAMPGEKEPTE
jgi:hypothetical protein